MILVEADRFEMGDEKNKHIEAIINDFYISKYQLTYAEFEEFCNDTGNEKLTIRDKGQPNEPINCITWYDAIEYCNWRSIDEGLEEVYIIDDTDDKSITLDLNKKGYRLPTEAEWEFACRGGTSASLSHLYSGSNNIDEVAWYWEPRELRKIRSVGKKQPNELGLYDMSGNVWEWCWDVDSTDDSKRIKRGGCWDSPAKACEIINSSSASPFRSTSRIGFRISRTC